MVSRTEAGDELYDDFFMNLAQKHGGIEPLLTTLFSFLHRKTDFYVVNTPEDHRMGFPPNVAENMLLKAYRKFPPKHIEDMVRQGLLPPMNVEKNKPTSNVNAKKEAPNKDVTQLASSSSKKDNNAGTQNSSAAQSSASSTTSSKNLSPVQQNEDKLADIKLSENGKQVPIGNGGTTEKYSWTQTLEEVTVYIDVPAGTTGKQVKCDMNSSSVAISLKDAGGDPLLKGSFPYKIKCDDSMWSLDSNKTIVLSLEKVKHTWWPNVIEGEPEIDTSKVDSRRNVNDYDPETQAQIRKIMFDQKQKALGLPTSEDITKNDILEKAKTMPGSPFLPKS